MERSPEQHRLSGETSSSDEENYVFIPSDDEEDSTFIPKQERISLLFDALERRDTGFFSELLTLLKEDLHQKTLGMLLINLARQEAVFDEQNNEMALELIKHGADPNIKDEDGTPLIHYLILQGHLELFQAITKIIDCGATDAEGKTILHHLAMRNNDADSNIAIILLERKPELSLLATPRGQTPLEYARAHNNLMLASIIQDYQVKVHGQFSHKPPSTQPLHTPIKEKMSQHDIEGVGVLLEQGHIPEQHDIDYARHQGFLELAHAMEVRLARYVEQHRQSSRHPIPQLESLSLPPHINLSADEVDPEIKDLFYSTCRQYCEQQRDDDMELIATLLQQGVHPDYIPTNSSPRILFLAIHLRNIQLIKLLLRYNASTNALEGEDKSPLTIANESGYLAGAQILGQAIPLAQPRASQSILQCLYEMQGSRE